MTNHRTFTSIVLVLLVVLSLGAMSITVAGTAASSDLSVSDPSLRSGFSQENGPTGTETEPNDSPSTANPIGPSDRIQGTISTEADFDAFTLQATAGQTIRTDLTRVGGQGLFGVAIIGPDGEVVSAVLAPPGETTRLSAPANVSGRYDVLIASASQFGLQRPDAVGTGEYIVAAESRSIGDGGFDVGEPTTGTTGPATTETPTTGPVTTALATTGTTTVTEAPTTESGAVTTQVATQRTETQQPGTQLPGTAVSETEPNDDPDTANPVQSGTGIQGVVSTETDLDAFTLQATAGQTIRTDLVRTGGQGLLVVVVFGPDGERVAITLAPPGETSRLVIPAEQSGQYFVVVAPASQAGLQRPDAAGTGPYLLTIETNGGGPTTGPVTPSPPTSSPPTTGPAQPTTGGPATSVPTPGPVATESEPNDGIDTANPIQLGSPVRGEVSSVQDIDIYRLDLQAGQTIRAQLARGQGSGVLVYVVVDPAGNPVTGAQVTVGETVEVAAEATQTGTYFVLVGAPSENGGTGGYELTVSASALGQGTPPGPFPVHAPIDRYAVSDGVLPARLDRADFVGWAR